MGAPAPSALPPFGYAPEAKAMGVWVQGRTKATVVMRQTYVIGW